MIGRTLFWYIFKDLMRIFFMASGALAGIMSFGGLLRPLTHQGLDVGQVGKLLSYFTPAMTTYSLPIAALFATTVVYGRLSADNELTACRAGGLSHLAVAFPAFVMGVLVAIMSLVFLCFIVPAYTLKVEQTLYSNMAKLIAGRIQIKHEVPFGPVTIFAQDAYIPPESSEKGQQVVVLRGPLIETTFQPDKKDRAYRIPRDFYTASEAVIYIEQRGKGESRGTGRMFLRIHLTDGMKFPREFQGATEGGVRATDYGPIELNSPIKEDTKFMDVWRLKQLYHDPSEGAKVKRLLEELVQRDQQVRYCIDIASKLNNEGKVTFSFPSGESYTLSRQLDGPPATIRGYEVLIAAPPQPHPAVGAATQPTIAPTADNEFRPVTFTQQSLGQGPLVYTAREAHLRVHPSGEPNTLGLSLELLDARDSRGVRKIFIQPLTVPMPDDVSAIGKHGVRFYANKAANPTDVQRVGRELLELSNEILAESNSRVSFAISCLVLVMVGCALGMMFRSGNFLSAFAISFIPALITITLIVAGQRMSGNVPDELKTDVAKYANTPLQLGLSLIWTGNCLNFILAVVLLGRLQKT